METFTVGQMAERLAKAKPSQTASFIARQIRGWAQADLFPDAGIRGTGRTAAQIFERHHLVTAQIYSFLTTLGMTVPQLKIVGATLSGMTSVKKVVKFYDNGDRDWRLIIYLTEDGDIWGGKLTKDDKLLRGVLASAPNVLILTSRSIFRALDAALGSDVPAPVANDSEK